MKPFADGCAVVEVYVDKFGKVTGRDYCWEPRKGKPERITARRYAALINQGLPFRVNTYGPSDQDTETEG